MKINVNDTKKIEAALAKVQAKSRERNYTFEDIIDLAEEAENAVAKFNPALLPKSNWKGTQFVDGYESFPNSYSYRAMGTIVCLQRGPNGWFMVECFRGDCKGETKNGLRFSDDQKDAMIKRIKALPGEF